MLTIEGFTITGGSGTTITDNENEPSVKEGGGIYIAFQTSFLTIRNCIIRDNKLEFLTEQPKGGGIFCFISTPTIENCIITENNKNDEVVGLGGGIYLSYSSPRIVDTEISNNIARHAGGIKMKYSSSPLLRNCLIKDNIAREEIDNPPEEGMFGGGISIDDTSFPSFIDCLISGNSAMEKGGGIYSEVSPSFINCTIVGNSAGFLGGVFIDFKPASASFLMENCILTGNTAAKGGAIWGNIVKQGATFPMITNCIIRNNGENANSLGKAIVTYCNIEGGYEGEGNIDEDPLFVAGPWGDYYLSQRAAGQDADSPCLNAGNSHIPIFYFEPEWSTTRTDGIFDIDDMDMGYHYPPHVQFGLSLEPEEGSYTNGDELTLLLDLKTAPAQVDADIYLLLLDPAGKFYSAPSWKEGPAPLVRNYPLPASLDLEDIEVVTFDIPSASPPIMMPGKYAFYIAALAPGTADFLSEIASAEFNVE